MAAYHFSNFIRKLITQAINLNAELAVNEQTDSLQLDGQAGKRQGLDVI
jgi:hypothetical protein